MTDMNTEVLNAVQEMRQTFEKTTSKIGNIEDKMKGLDGLDQEKIFKINNALENFEKENQKKVEALEKQRAEFDSLKEQINSLSADNKEIIQSLAYSKTSTNGEEISENTISEFAKVLKNDKEFLFSAYPELAAKFSGLAPTTEGPASNNILRTDINAKGGFLVPTALANKIFKEASDVSEIDKYCSTFSSDAKTLNVRIEKETDTDETYFVNEAMEGREETESFDLRFLTSYRQNVSVGVTRDQLLFSDQDIVSLITKKVVDKFGKGFSRAVLKGEIAKDQPEGIMTSSKIKSVETGTAGSIDFDDMLLLPVADNMKSAYAKPGTSRYYFNLRTLFSLRLLKDATGQYLWSPSLDSAAPATINGFNYAIVSEMDDIAQGKCPVLFGDLRSAYGILKTKGLTMIRDDYTHKKKSVVEFTWERWLGGKIFLEEAVRKLQVKNS